MSVVLCYNYFYYLLLYQC